MLEDHLQRAQIREGLLGRLEVRLGNNFHQRRAGTVEIDERRIAEVRRLRDILLKVDAVELHHLVWVGNLLAVIGRVTMVVKRHTTTNAERQIHLRRLVVFWHVRIEVILAIPLRNFRRRAADHHTSEQGFFDRRLIEHRQGTWQAKANRAGVRVGLIAKRSAARAKHLGAGLDLAVDFKADGDEVGHGEKYRNLNQRLKV